MESLGTMSAGDASSALLVSVSATVETSSPDDSDGLATSLGGEALAVGEDTLAVGAVSGALVDSGSVITIDGSATMAAASKAPSGETAITDAYTFAEISDGAEFAVVVNQETDISRHSASGNTSTSTSSTSIAVYDLRLDDTGTAIPVFQELDGVNDDAGAGAKSELDSLPDETNEDCDLDGNIAVIEFAGLAVGEDTLVSVDAFAIIVEDDLSLASALVVLAVD